jgi:hypothetical protein
MHKMKSINIILELFLLISPLYRLRVTVTMSQVIIDLYNLLVLQGMLEPMADNSPPRQPFITRHQIK